MDNMMDGFSHDELMAIGSRKTKLGFSMSATDINRSIPYAMAQAALSTMEGLSDDQLKNIAERKVSIVALPDSNTLPVNNGDVAMVSDVMHKLSKILGVRI